MFGMSGEVERKILKEIEEEVQRILSEEKRREVSKTSIDVHYLKSMKEDLLRNLIEAGGGKMILIALDQENLSRLKGKISELARKIREANGELYFIRWPTLLISLGDVQIKVHD